MDAQTDIVGWIDRWTDKWTDIYKCMDGQTDRLTDPCIEGRSCSTLIIH